MGDGASSMDPGPADVRPGGGRRPSLKDVAARAGVSFQTVSKVLRGDGNVTEATRARIESVARDLGYVPDEVARSLVEQRTRSLGLVVGDLSDHVVARFIPGAEQEARHNDHALAVVGLAPDSDAGQRSVRGLLSRRVDGIVAAAPQLEEDPRLGDLLAGVPTVAIHSIRGLEIPLVGSDQVETGREATRHLLDLGRRRVGSVTGLHTRRVTSSRIDGWEQAHDLHGFVADPDLLEEGDWTPQGGAAAVGRLLDRAPDLDALFVHNDLMAVGALHELHHRGRSVPHDVAVMGCDDIPVAGWTWPSLSTIAVPFFDTGVAAVRLLLDRIAGIADADTRVLLPTRRRCRSSCGCEGATSVGST